MNFFIPYKDHNTKLSPVVGVLMHQKITVKGKNIESFFQIWLLKYF